MQLFKILNITILVIFLFVGCGKSGESNPFLGEWSYEENETSILKVSNQGT